MDAAPAHDTMVAAFMAGDKTYDGVFFTAVKTTGIFCRPGCPARKPLPENVTFYSTVREALFAGYRPCKRCTPLDTPGKPPEWVARLIARLDEAPDARIGAADLRRDGIEPGRARRWFKTHYGMTFSAFGRARRLSGALATLREGKSVDDAVFESGYLSHSGFRDAFTRTFGATPGKGGQVDSVALGWIESPVGPLIAGADDRGICLLEFSDRRMLEAQLQTLSRRLRRPLVPGEHHYLEALRTEIGEYFAGTRKVFEVPLNAPGTPFQERVWKALLAIPYGEVRSYEQIAFAVGSPKAVRAVGTANGMNRIAIVIPCHRVIGKDGTPTGYGGGIWRKQRLLALERGEKGTLPFK
jgi:AraC family transcriptional regulator, regulatory protein of adaptative response / methylated-DNA-[protein]-cysteine methyltransferase